MSSDTEAAEAAARAAVAAAAAWSAAHSVGEAVQATLAAEVEIVPGHQSDCFAGERKEKRGPK